MKDNNKEKKNRKSVVDFLTPRRASPFDFPKKFSLKNARKDERAESLKLLISLSAFSITSLFSAFFASLVENGHVQWRYVRFGWVKFKFFGKRLEAANAGLN